jgi:hypothetical protein
VSFAHPALAWGALAGLIPVILHLIDRRRARPQPFAAIDFVLRSRRSTARRLRLRRLLLLLMRMALLTALPLALARPQLASAAAAATSAAHGPTATALILDGSGSMRYRRGGETLFARAQALARERLAALPVDDSVVAFVCAPRSPAPGAPSFDHAAARAVLDAALASEEPVGLTGCLAEAARALGESPLAGKRLVLFTDLTAADWDLSQPAPEVPTASGPVRPELEVEDVAGGPLPNRALTDLDVAPAPDVGPHAYRFSFTVHNYSDAAAEDVPVGLRSGDQLLARGFCALAAHGSQRKTLAASFPPGQRAVGAVELAADDLPEDDSRAYTLDVPREIRVLLVNGAPSPIRYQDEAYFAQMALEAGASAIQTRTVDPDAFGERDLEAQDVVFLLNVRTVSAEAAAALTGFADKGGGIFLSMGDRVDPEVLNGALGKLLPLPLRLVKTAAPPSPDVERGRPAEAQSGEENGLTGRTPAHFAHFERASAIFSPFGGVSEAGLLDVRIYRYFLVDPSGASGAHVLASYDDGAPALVEAKRGAGRVILFTSSVAREWSDWPIRTSFVPTLQQIAKYLAGVTQERPEPATIVGRPHPLRPVAGKTAVTVVSPSGAELPVESGTAGETVAAPPEVGLYRVRSREGRGPVTDSLEQAFAVVYDPSESDTTRLDRSELAARYGRATLGKRGGESGELAAKTPLWTELLACAAVAFLLEGVLLRR